MNELDSSLCTVKELASIAGILVLKAKEDRQWSSGSIAEGCRRICSSAEIKGCD